jgi:endo-1,4-beta-xylanase
MKLKLAVPILVFILLSGCEQSTGPDPDNNDGDNLPDPSLAPALKTVFKDHFVIGSALTSQQFNETDNRARPIIAKHFNTITPENHMKWDHIQPVEGQFTFESADRFVSFGEAHDMHIVGHTLIWHSQTPAWVFTRDNGSAMVPGNADDRALLLERMENHITTVVSRYKGQVHGWDVVNEAVETGPGGVDGLRNSLWHQIIGPEFIARAFEFAHAADPDAGFYYNDYSLADAGKRQRTVRLVEELLAEGVPITGVGMQGHYHLGWPPASQFRASIQAFADLDVDVMISELDVSVLDDCPSNPYRRSCE